MLKSSRNSATCPSQGHLRWIARTKAAQLRIIIPNLDSRVLLYFERVPWRL
jgi:hypothetical protein